VKNDKRHPKLNTGHTVSGCFAWTQRTPFDLEEFENHVRCFQELYKRIGEYLELQERVIVLNNRFEVLTELLNIVREHENNLHIARLV
jgi:hypothetical protein